MLIPHEIEWVFDGPGMVRGKLVCHAPEQSDCRLVNKDCDCESWSQIRHDHDGTPYHEVDTWEEDPRVARLVRHDMTWQAECNIALFVNDGDLEELCQQLFLIGRTPVNPVWEGDYYSWEPVTVGNVAVR